MILAIAILLLSIAGGNSQDSSCDSCKQDNSECGWLNLSCRICETFTIPFNYEMQPIVAACSQEESSLGHRDLVNDAIDVLVERGFFTRDEFTGVDVFFCDDLESASTLATFGVTGDFAGMAYVDTILIVEDYTRDLSFESFASLLAHELFHIRQYRSLGLDKFACQYTNEIVQGNGSGRDNAIEAPAYSFADNVLACLTNKTDCQEP